MALKILGETKISGSAKILSRQAADFIVKLSRKTLKEQKYFTLALSGGKTPLGLYKLLGKRSYRNKINWKKVCVFWADERFVSAGNHENNFKAFCKVFGCRDKIPRQNLHNIETNLKTHLLSAKLYEAELKKFFGREKTPRFDLIILGVGFDGHTASLFPYNKALYEKRRLVVAVNAPKQRIKKRITLTIPVLNNAKNILFLVSGRRKKSILRKLESLKNPTPKYPVSMLKPKGRIYLFAGGIDTPKKTLDKKNNNLFYGFSACIW
jgi:6-phosphogluconolactonase